MAAGKKESLFSPKKEGSEEGKESPAKRVEENHGSDEKKSVSGENSNSNEGRGTSGGGQAPSKKEAAPADMKTRHMNERREMRSKHEQESKDMHGNHRDERRKMGERHEVDHKALNARQLAEEQAAQQAGMPAGAGPEMGTAGPSPNNVAPAGAGGGGI
jgi:hypothetical protein